MTATTGVRLLSVRVASKTVEAEGICSFELVDVDGGPLPRFTAGAHIDVHVPGGLVRQYSLCNDAAERHRYLIATLRDPNSRGGSVAMHDHVHEGDTIRISEPRNHFELQAAERFLLFAGGIGITPILCMAQQLAGASSAFELHYCTRSPERTAFTEKIAQSAFVGRVRIHHDTGADGQRMDIASVLAQPDANARIYVCGPSGFIEHVVDAARHHGWPASNVHLEHFAAAPADGSADTAFRVQVASTGATFEIPVGKTVLEVLLAGGVEIPTSCEAGVCGTCATRVLAGTPDHRDAYFTEAERAANDQFTPCCSRAKGPLLIVDL